MTVSPLFRFRNSLRTGLEAEYEERPSGYSLPVERHAYWDLVYLDHGRLYLSISGVGFSLQPGEFVFVRQGELYALETSWNEAAFYATVHFETGFEPLATVANRGLRGDHELRRLVSEILKQLSIEEEGADELARCYLTELAILSVRRNSDTQKSAPAPAYSQIQNEKMILDRIRRWIQEHAAERLSLNDIARAAGFSPSRLEQLFIDSRII